MKTDILKFMVSGALASILLTAGGCSESPFEDNQKGEGMLHLGAMGVDYMNREKEVRASATDVNDFTVNIIDKKDGAVAQSYRYGDMPEIVTLPVGEYRVEANYGTNEIAAWESPYYLGSSEFSIRENEITDNVAPVVCTLNNIRVNVNFGSELLAKMGEDCKVTVHVGESTTSLDFTPADAGRSGYFRHVEGSPTITAVLTGTVDGDEVKITKAYDNAAKGNFYRINFEVRNVNDPDPGHASGSITVDATIDRTDMNQNVSGDLETIEDDMRPVEGDDPNNPDNPDNPDDPQKPAPTITAQAPIDLDKVNIFDPDDATAQCILNVHSEAEGGITAFTVDIDSNTLTPEELESVNMSSHLDLVNPGSLETALKNLQLPVNIGGQTDIEFNISGFLPMLGMLGPGDHKFILTVTDANGTTVATLKLKNN